MFVVHLLLWQLNFLPGLIKFLQFWYFHSFFGKKWHVCDECYLFWVTAELMPSKFRHSNTVHLYCLFFFLVTQSLVALTSTGIFHYQMNAQHCAAIETGNSGTELFSNLSRFLNLKHPPKPDHRLRAARCLPAIVPTGRESSEKERLQRCARVTDVFFISYQQYSFFTV